MKISAKTEYACIAMLELATQFESAKPVQIRKIAERHDIPPRFLVQILLQLKGAGLVLSIRGASGGYHLAKPPKDISLGEVMAVIGGSSQQDNRAGVASSGSSAARVLIATWTKVGAVQRQMLDEISLAELIEQAKDDDSQMYYI